jgi:hypothetical protein
MNDNHPLSDEIVLEEAGTENYTLNTETLAPKTLPMHLNGLSKKQPPHLRAQKILK